MRKRDRNCSSEGMGTGLDRRTAIVAAVASLQNTVLDEFAQPVRQDVARNAQLRLELLEMTQAEEGPAENQKRPALADNFQCRRKAANMRSKLNLFGIHQPRR